MAIRLSGLTSGLDTEALVSELVKAYSKKTEKYEKEQTKLSWKQESWKNLNAKIYSLYTNVGNLRYSSAYTIRKRLFLTRPRQRYLLPVMPLLLRRN